MLNLAPVSALTLASNLSGRPNPRLCLLSRISMFALPRARGPAIKPHHATTVVAPRVPSASSF
jgi:hypothetical protein